MLLRSLLKFFTLVARARFELLRYFKSECPRSSRYDIYAMPQAFLQLTV